jgi:hypothetical protein
VPQPRLDPGQIIELNLTATLHNKYTVNGSYYFSNFHVHFSLQAVDLFTFIYGDHTSGKQKFKSGNVLWDIPKLNILG